MKVRRKAAIFHQVTTDAYHLAVVMRQLANFIDAHTQFASIPEIYVDESRNIVVRCTMFKETLANAKAAVPTLTQVVEVVESGPTINAYGSQQQQDSKPSSSRH